MGLGKLVRYCEEHDAYFVNRTRFQQDETLAIFMATNTRLGENSLLKQLNGEVMRMISYHVNAFETEDEAHEYYSLWAKNNESTERTNNKWKCSWCIKEGTK